MKFTVNTEINDTCILQTTRMDMVDVITKRLVDTQEESIRKALIEMGWTPPQEKHNDTTS